MVMSMIKINHLRMDVAPWCYKWIWMDGRDWISGWGIDIISISNVFIMIIYGDNDDDGDSKSI